MLPEKTWRASQARGPGGPGPNPPGTTLSYTRSNQDGTKPERVYVHVVSPMELHVAKMVKPCTDAAYVTAVFDPVFREVARMVGGRLKRDGTQDPQAFLDLDRNTRTFSVRFGDPESKPVETLAAPQAPWRMYDFDLAEFALSGPMNGDFGFNLVMAWPEGPPPTLRKLGKASARMIVSSVGGEGANQMVFAVSGEAFGPDGGGILKLDPNRGHVIEATFSLPNHPGYEDFRLVLDSFDQDHGKEVWADALASHWKDCPA
jgi:hypothetical protein